MFGKDFAGCGAGAARPAPFLKETWWVTGLLILAGWAFPLQAQRVLFDWTKNETAGNSDWVVDHQAPLPTPQNPTGPDVWDGALSHWGYTFDTLHIPVRTLPPGHTLHYGLSDTLDLSQYDLLILPEPQNPLSSSEISAVLTFLQNGGSMVFLADHNSSDRDGDGWDSPRVWNAAFESTLGVHCNITGERYNSYSASITNVSTNLLDPIIHGPYGDVTGVGYHAGTVMTLDRNVNPTLQGHVWVNNKPQADTLVVVVCGEYGSGRFCVIGDSSPADDGTGNPGDNLYDNWHELDNSTLLLNMSFWAAPVLQREEHTTPTHGRAPVRWIQPGEQLRLDRARRYRITNVLGQVVLQGRAQTISLSSLPAGIYRLNIGKTVVTVLRGP